MTQPPSARTPERIFPVLHLVLVAGVAMTVVVFAVVRSVVPLDPMTDLIPVFRIAAAISLVGAYVVMRMFRADIVPLTGSGDPSSWWRLHGTKALLIWVIAEGAAMIGTVFWFLTGDIVLLTGVAGVALVLLVMNRPGRLMDQ